MNLSTMPMAERKDPTSPSTIVICTRLTFPLDTMLRALVSPKLDEYRLISLILRVEKITIAAPSQPDKVIMIVIISEDFAA